MSLLANHGVIGGVTAIPIVVSTSQNLASGLTFTVTPAVAPTSGNLMIITSGGVQNRTVSANPSGFTRVDTSGVGSGTNVLWWKYATGSEPADYTITWSGSLDGGWSFTEIRNVVESSPIFYHSGNSGIGVTSLNAAPSNFNVPGPGIAITYISKSSTSAWTTNNGYVTFNPSGEHKIAKRIYSAVALGENVTWSGSSETVLVDIIFIKGKTV